MKYRFSEKLKSGEMSSQMVATEEVTYSIWNSLGKNMVVLCSAK